MDGLTDKEEIAIGTDINKPDTDQDEVLDGQEVKKYKTNPLEKDTDGDKLYDGYEIYTLGTSPLEYDTDNEGLSDADKDKDNDGLSNIIECELGTNPNEADTDLDGLTDGEEINKYKTNPLDNDTDDDELDDGFEIFKSFTDPNNEDTNGNGVIDSKEKYSVTIEDSTNMQSKDVSISIDINDTGKAIESLIVTKDLNEITFLNSNIPGYIDTAFYLDGITSGNSAKIKFEYNNDLKKQRQEFSPEIYYFNEETNKLEKLNTSKSRSKDNQVEADISKSGYYTLLNSNEWNESWNKNLAPIPVTDEYDVLFSLDLQHNAICGDAEHFTAQMALGAVTHLSYNNLANCRMGVVEANSKLSMPIGFTNNKNTIGNRYYYQGVPFAWGDGWYTNDQILNYSMDMFDRYSNTNRKKVIVLISDGPEYMSNISEATIQRAQKNNIQVNTIGVICRVFNPDNNDTVEKLKDISDKTGGTYTVLDSTYNSYDTSKDVNNSINNIKDSDKDGLSDLEEEKGFRLENGEIVKTDPHKADSDGDGLSDRKELGKPMYIKYLDRAAVKENTDDYVEGYTDENKMTKVNTKMLIEPMEAQQSRDFVTEYYYRNTSHPNLIDTDDDNLNDGQDKEPMKFNVSDKHLLESSKIAYNKDIQRMLFGSKVMSIDENDEYFMQLDSNTKKILLDNFKGWEIKGNGVSLSGFKAVSIEKGTEVIFAFAGTDGGEYDYDLILDVIADAGIIKGYNTQSDEAIRFVNKNLKNKDERVRFNLTGHSLGGFLTTKSATDIIDVRSNSLMSNYFTRVGIFNTEHLKKGTIQKAVTFNGAGVPITPFDMPGSIRWNRSMEILINSIAGKYDDTLLNYSVDGDPLTSPVMAGIFLKRLGVVNDPFSNLSGEKFPHGIDNFDAHIQYYTRNYAVKL